jgi:hypothetical protein
MPVTGNIILSRQLYVVAFEQCQALHNGSIDWQEGRLKIQRQRELNVEPKP